MESSRLNYKSRNSTGCINWLQLTESERKIMMEWRESTKRKRQRERGKKTFQFPMDVLNGFHTGTAPDEDKNKTTFYSPVPRIGAVS